MILKSNQNFVGKMLLLKMITEIKLVLTSNSGIKKLEYSLKPNTDKRILQYKYFEEWNLSTDFNCLTSNIFKNSYSPVTKNKKKLHNGKIKHWYCQIAQILSMLDKDGWLA